MSGGKLTIRSIALALDASGIHPDALELACRLARLHGVELLSLLIEDIELLHAASLPFAREIAWHSGEERALDRDALMARLQEQAEEVREQLARQSDPAGLRYSLRTSRGRFEESVLEALKNADLLIMGRPRRSRWLTSVSAHAPLVLLCNSDRDDGRLEAAAAALSEGRARRVRWTDPVRTLAVLRHLHPGVVVAPASLTERERRSLRILLDALDCPLVLIRDQD